MLDGLEGLRQAEVIAVWTVLVISVLSIAYAFVIRAQILAQDKGTAKMQEVWGFIKAGANAYLSQQFRTIAILIAVLMVAATLAMLARTSSISRVIR